MDSHGVVPWEKSPDPMRGVMVLPGDDRLGFAVALVLEPTAEDLRVFDMCVRECATALKKSIAALDSPTA